jgi:2-iminobutanoate/2-iminopropanoate deaminase
MAKKIIQTKEAPKANGCYSQGVLAGNTLYVSGQLPIQPQTGRKLIDEPLEVQARQVFMNIIEIVKAAGGSVDDVVKVSVYISDISNWDIVNEVYKNIFTKDYPARCVLAIPALHYGFKIEAEAIAYICN